jgi:hypothetical protein
VKKGNQVTPVAAEKNAALPHLAPLEAVAGAIESPEEGKCKRKVNVEKICN